MASGELIIKGGFVIDPTRKIDGDAGDIAIKDGKIVDKVSSSAKVIDAKGKVVMAGGVDVHSHVAGPKVNVGRLFRPEDNLESHYARDALRHLYVLLVMGKVDGCSLGTFEDATGLKLTDSNGIRDELPPITTFLNRLLALTIGVIATIGASGSGDMFWQFFSDFHGLFFTGNSWLFADSTTLIRLYPLQFWQDAVLYIGIVAAAGGLGCVFIPRSKA